ncbi:MAG: M1 family aminopeptidase [Candidatus Nitrosocaldus sp.]|nr:M1 family aminopeptidase [Candidatus Nitrosocaldus sp.]
MDRVAGNSRRFELPGSRPHYPPSRQFMIRHIRLEIRPDMNEGSITAREEIDLVSNAEELRSVVLDAAELNISRVMLGEHELTFKHLDDRLRVELPEPLREGEGARLAIEYTAKPRKGLYFVRPDEHYPRRRLQAWTQGESVYSRYWFVCLDHPDMRHTSEMIVDVPDGFIAISNGRLVSVEDRGSHRRYHWLEECTHPAYLTSLVIGRFKELRDEYNGIELLYYVPEDMADYAELSFANTKDMMRFFEEYTGIKYPYSKYAQVTVDDFIYGGMENINATTLTVETLHDRRAHIDFTSDHLVAHELAHQWFGDLVTCRDWQHIWLNESFATYFEALYWLHSRGEDEFNYYIMQYANEYFEEYGKRYARAIVTNVYKHPDDLFDRHAYEKGACVLHMLRSMMGDRLFRRAVKYYLERFRFSNAESEEFRRCCEDATGYSLQEFFEQWLYRAGHPELKIKVDYNHDGRMLTLNMVQVQSIDGESRIFRFPLDVHVVSRDGRREQITVSVEAKEQSIHIPLRDEPMYVSIDPLNKVPLKKVVELKMDRHMLIAMLKHGNTVERISAARALASTSMDSDDVIGALRDAILGDAFWGVAAESARALAGIKGDKAYNALISVVESVKHPKARRAVVRAIGEFAREDSIALLNRILQSDESYYVQAETVIAMGKSRSKKAVPYIMGSLQIRSHNEVVRASAMTAFGEVRDEFSIPVLIDHTRLGEHNRVREAAALALGKYAKGNERVVDHLIALLRDHWFRVRMNAIKALAEAQEQRALKDLEWVAANDNDARVRRVADEAILTIREATQVPKEVAQMRDELERLKSMSRDIMSRLDMVERELKSG